MLDWHALEAEFDLWRAQGRTATLWWRDDDATRVTPELLRLLGISQETLTPVALAIIPSDAEPELRDLLSTVNHHAVLQHGWAHYNHAPAHERQQEYGAHRPLESMLQELGLGWERVRAFERSLPILVAPWNRIAAELIPHLPVAGLTAISTLGARQSAEPSKGVRCVNVHIDIIDWQGTRGFAGLNAALKQLVDHLQKRRAAEVDPDEPTGLMTHHLFHDEGCWAFISELLERTRNHPSCRWLDAREAFWP